MLTLRRLPPDPVAGNLLLGDYHRALRRHWSAADRAAGRLLDRIAPGGGWSAAEKRFLSPEIRASGLSMRERKGLHRLLNPAAFPLRDNPLKDKALFARHVGRHALPAPATFDASAGALDAWLDARNAIIAKPSFSSKGRGVVAFGRKGAGWRGAEGPLDAAALAAQLRRVLARGGVVQERLGVHPDLADLSPNALPTLRVMTCLDEAGAPEACAVVLRLSSGGPLPVDNFNAGNLAVRLDARGRCAEAYRLVAGGVIAVDSHPATTATIPGRPAPDLDAAVALALRAHATLGPGWAVVAWDVGLTDRGAVLVEGNWNPGTQILQLVEGRGIDRTRLGALYRHHLLDVPPKRWRAARPVQLDGPIA